MRTMEALDCYEQVIELADKHPKNEALQEKKKEALKKMGEIYADALIAKALADRPQAAIAAFLGDS